MLSHSSDEQELLPALSSPIRSCLTAVHKSAWGNSQGSGLMHKQHGIC
jgi:hypothetical protein